MRFRRKILDNIERQLAAREIIVITGMRRVGKITCDNGMINLFGKVSDGSLLENAVFNNFRHYARVNYYQKRSGAEVEFILPEEMVAFEVKKRGREQDYRKLLKLSQSLNMQEWYVISQDFSSERGIVLAQDL